ncbi:DUF2851 family protein [Flavobacterium amnicola]|uniref:DUF2851 family protein n=1 Tax=Flavobacterium amnicola TaxID=2506422 RepID=A0A4Q1K3R3_9FLAO|nr:DUF2851 family protein [Flavobacterium amnicola]RXR20456.1 DUF2851 family protein [Flavobacterium amnicola]
MKEDFLHYVWQNQKFDFANLQTSEGELLQILQTGKYLHQAGPDFFNAQIIVGNQKWAGNVEIHLKSSDWYLHHHETDKNYDNVILHVVWEHDVGVLRKDKSEIPVLELKGYVANNLRQQYQQLKLQKSWINCENDIQKIPQFIFKNWQERLFFERLERKSKPILESLETNNYDWEATLFCFLAKNFGLNTNGEVFFQLANAIPFSVIRKESFDVQYLEALFFGKSNLIPTTPEDSYSKDLRNLYDYISMKYQLQTDISQPVHFYKLRPDNFPTIRLAQFAMLYHKQQNLFTKIIGAKSMSALHQLFNISVSDYWLHHYNFEKPSKYKQKSLSKSFVELVIINTVLPIKFAYEQSLSMDFSEENIDLLEQIQPENNTIIDKFKSIGVECKSAFQTQALLQLKKEYCEKGKCLQCAIGIELLKN